MQSIAIPEVISKFFYSTEEVIEMLAKLVIYGIKGRKYRLVFEEECLLEYFSITKYKAYGEVRIDGETIS